MRLCYKHTYINITFTKVYLYLNTHSRDVYDLVIIEFYVAYKIVLYTLRLIF